MTHRIPFTPSIFRRRALSLLLLGAAALTPLIAPMQAQAQAQAAFPLKPIKLIVPYAAGGGVDIVGRGLAEGLTRQFGWIVSVENRTGAGSNVGSTAVAKSDPDGYTLLVGSNANAVNISLYDSMPYDPVKELTPIVFIGRTPMVMLAAPSTPFKSVRDVVAEAKAKPGSLNFGSGGSGTSEHLTSELFKRRAGIQATHIPYRGGAAVYPDLMSGRVQLFFNNQLQAMPFINSGQVRAIGIANPKRSPQLPDVPTLDEQGIFGFAASGWWCIMGPGNMPAALVNQLNTAVNAVIDSPEFTKRLESLGAERMGGTPQFLNEYFRNEMSVWADIIKTEKIKVE